jgi:hypothetical protein
MHITPHWLKPSCKPACAAWLGLSLLALNASAAVQVTVAHNTDDEATGAFVFKNVPAPSRNDAATAAQFSVVAGEADGNSAGLRPLHDGRLPGGSDEPGENFFFAAGTAGGRLVVDLGRAIDLKQVNTYSWHVGTRAPQVYKLYASAGGDFNAKPGAGVDPTTCGWKWIADVDTRPKQGDAGGQYGVSIADPAGNLGSYRYLLFDVSRTESDDAFGNTFYSEIDAVDAHAPAAPVTAASPRLTFTTADGSCEIAIDTSAAPELADWAERKLGPTLAEWFPKIVAMLPSDGYVAPKSFSITLRPSDDVAFAAGTRIMANSRWLKSELKGEAVGALVHEMVHVIQQYGAGRRNNPQATRTPGWLVEGIPDYIRWFKYEPQSHGADLLWLQERPDLKLNYDARYRVTANFIDYVMETHDPAHTLLAKINAACRAGEYRDELWQQLTGKSLAQLNDDWKEHVQSALAARAKTGLNVLTPEERKAGWRLLFNGVDTAGWHNFKHDGVRPGWEVKDGALVCADPHNAGDIVTVGQYGAFELELDYNISEGGNSGIIYHVSDEGGAVWATGPEFQLEDNAKAADPQRCGWLYALYQPPNDPQTGKPLDATKPAGQWNHVRLVITPEKCEHYINGVKYFDYVLGSDDFKARVAKSKFASMPLFAKFDRGYLALQGDHGRVEFRNIKIRPLRPAAN